jgi:hypothetical protein
MDLKDIARVFLSTAAEYTFFLAVCETFSKVYHILGHEEILPNTKIEIFYFILVDHDGTKLEISSKKNYKNCRNKGRSKNTLLFIYYFGDTGN